MNWPNQPPDDAVELRRALDRAEDAVRDVLGHDPGAYYRRSNETPPSSVKLAAVIQVAVEAALEA